MRIASPELKRIQETSSSRNARSVSWAAFPWGGIVDNRVLLRLRQQHDGADIPPCTRFLQHFELRRPKRRAVIRRLDALAFGNGPIKVGRASRGVTLQKNDNAVFAGVEIARPPGSGAKSRAGWRSSLAGCGTSRAGCCGSRPRAWRAESAPWHPAPPSARSIPGRRMSLAILSYRSVDVIVFPPLLQEPRNLVRHLLLVPHPQMTAARVADEARAWNLFGGVAGRVVGAE